MTVLITGANRGIGLALAKAYVESGESVIGTRRDVPPSPGDSIEWQYLDVADKASHIALVNRLGQRPIEYLICNAGVYLEKGGEYAPDNWAATFAVNVTGVFLSIDTLLPNLRAAKGKIAIISSKMGSDARAPGGSYIYRASKAAALNLGRNLAADLRSEGIAVGIYHPGWVVTDMGGPGADISVTESASGLMKRFALLSLTNSGCFESFDGSALAF